MDVRDRPSNLKGGGVICSVSKLNVTYFSLAWADKIFWKHFMSEKNNQKQFRCTAKRKQYFDSEKNHSRPSPLSWMDGPQPITYVRIMDYTPPQIHNKHTKVNNINVPHMPKMYAILLSNYYCIFQWSCPLLSPAWCYYIWYTWCLVDQSQSRYEAYDRPVHVH